MSLSMIPASVKGGCGESHSLYSTPVLPSYPQITEPPPPELVIQNLQKRVDATCGFSGTEFFGCPLNSYCIYNSGYGRWGCCQVSSDTVIASTCYIGETVCIGSSESLASYGTDLCPNDVACCPEADYPSCVTAILSVDPTLTYSSFFCSQITTDIFVTPINEYVLQSETNTVTVTKSASTVYISNSDSTSSTSADSSSAASTASSSSQFLPLTTSTTLSSASSSGTGLPDIGPNPNNHSTHTGAIIGGVVGGVALVAIVVLGFFIRHRIHVKRHEAGLSGAPEMTGRVVSGSVYNSVPTTAYER